MYKLLIIVFCFIKILISHSVIDYQRECFLLHYNSYNTNHQAFEQCCRNHIEAEEIKIKKAEQDNKIYEIKKNYPNETYEIEKNISKNNTEKEAFERYLESIKNPSLQNFAKLLFEEKEKELKKSLE